MIQSISLFLETSFQSVQFSRSVMSDSLQPHGLQHARPPCPSTYPGADFFTLLFHFHQEALSFFFALKPQTCINIGIQRVFGWWIQIYDVRVLCSLGHEGSPTYSLPSSYTPPPFHSFWIFISINLRTGFPLAQSGKTLPAVQETQFWSLDWEDSLEKQMATYSNILAWKISWTQEPGGLQSMGSQKVGHDWATNT